MKSPCIEKCHRPRNSGITGMQVFPLEVVRRRMQTMAADSLSRKAGMVVLRQAVMDIWAREKLKGFYAGMLPNTVQVDTRLLTLPADKSAECQRMKLNRDTP